jgi:hypothetical protein
LRLKAWVRRRRWYLRVGAILMILTLGLVFWAVFGKWQWGNVPAWVAGIGTVATFSFVALSYNRDLVARRQTEEKTRTETMQSQARLFDAWAEPSRIDTDNRVYTLMVSNGSAQAIRDVTVTVLVTAWAVGSFRWPSIVPPTALGDYPKELFTEVLGEDSPLRGRPIEEVRENTRVSVRFVDANGTRWYRTGGGELVNQGKVPFREQDRKPPEVLKKPAWLRMEKKGFIGRFLTDDQRRYLQALSESRPGDAPRDKPEDV